MSIVYYNGTSVPSTTPPLSEIGQQLLYVKNNIGGLFFDAFLKLTHTSSLTITQHPVETGAAISDHSYIMPTTLVCDIGVSDVGTSIVPGQFGGQTTLAGLAGPIGEPQSRSVNAFQALLALQQSRVPVQVTTRLNLYNNMLIQSIVTSEDNTTAHAWKATVTMQEIFVAVVQTVKVSSQPQVTDSTVKGVVQPAALTPANAGAKSLIMAIYNAL
jgi:hypothetical protein